MKKQILYALAMLMSGMMLFSCQQDDVTYSCDPNADAWVKENI